VNDDSQLEVVKWYTRARRFPQLIGRTPDGTKIPGGPYTFTQVLGGAAFLVVAWQTLPVWGAFGLIGNAMVMLVATWLLIVGLGRIPIGARNPLSLAEGAVRALTAPAAGRVGGREVRIRRPHRARTVLVVSRPHVSTTPAPVPQPVVTTAALATAAAPAATSGPPSEDAFVEAPASSRSLPTPPPLTPPPLTSVQRILAGAGPRQKDS